jgi:phosphoglycerate dehydrogenase-like enzyme
MHKLTIISQDAEMYSALLAEKKLPDLTVSVAAKSTDEINLSSIKLLLSEPNIAAQILSQCDQLKWMQSTWAGNAPLINNPKKNYILTSVKGIFGVAIREYVFAYLLYFERNIAAFGQNWTQPCLGTLQGKRLGILGAGSIASELVEIAHAFGMRVIGANRSGNSNCDYDEIYAIDCVEAFTSDLDYLVCILPETPTTEHIVNSQFLAQLPSNCVIINAGRGATIDDDALIDALNANRLKAAVLDVFDQEPLPSGHPYWQMDNVYVTQHTAAISQPQAVIEVFAENYHRWRNQQPLKYCVDFTRGY